MIPKFIYLAPLSNKIYKLTHETQIEKISNLSPTTPPKKKKKKPSDKSIGYVVSTL